MCTVGQIMVVDFVNIDAQNNQGSSVHKISWVIILFTNACTHHARHRLKKANKIDYLSLSISNVALLQQLVINSNCYAIFRILPQPDLFQFLQNNQNNTKKIHILVSQLWELMFSIWNEIILILKRVTFSLSLRKIYQNISMLICLKEKSMFFCPNWIKRSTPLFYLTGKGYCRQLVNSIKHRELKQGEAESLAL